MRSFLTFSVLEAAPWSSLKREIEAEDVRSYLKTDIPNSYMYSVLDLGSKYCGSAKILGRDKKSEEN